MFHVCVLGSTQAGKTCFLAGLEILNEANRESEVAVKARGRSLQYLQEQGSLLRRQGWPAGTNVTEKITFDIAVGGESLSVFLLDYPGGDFERFLATTDPGDVRDLGEQLRRADVLLLLMDPVLDILNYKGCGPEETEALMRRQSAHLGCIMDEYSRRLGEKTNPWDPRRHLRVGLVLTKCDQRPELFGEAERAAFLRENAGPLLDKLGARSRELRTFALSAVGAVEEREDTGGRYLVPSRKLEPRGYEELFRWVAGAKARVEWAGWAAKVAAVAALVLGVTCLAGLVTFGRYQSFRSRMDGETLSLAQKIREPEPGLMFGLAGHFKPTKVDEYLAQVGRTLAGNREAVPLVRLNEEMLDLQGAIPATREDAFREAHGRVRAALDEALYTVVCACKGESQEEVDACNQYLRLLPGGGHRQEVEARLLANQKAGMDAAKRQINQMVVTTRQNLKSKADAAEDFLSRYGAKLPADESVGMKGAIELAKKMFQGGQWEIAPKSLGGVPGPYHVIVETYVAGQLVRSQKGNGAMADHEWTGSEAFTLPWTSGQALKVIVWYDSYPPWSDVQIASLETDAPDAILALVDKAVKFTPLNGYDTGAVAREYRIKQVPENLQESYKKFINPGAFWAK